MRNEWSSAFPSGVIILKLDENVSVLLAFSGLPSMLNGNNASRLDLKLNWAFDHLLSFSSVQLR